MKDKITIRPHNKRAYMDLIREVLKKRNGLLSFVLRVSSGNIVDMVIMENKKFK